MYLKHFKMIKIQFSSNATRNSNYFPHRFMLQNKFKKLTWVKKSLSGRNDSRRVILWTKGPILDKFRSVNINYSNRYNKLMLISSIQFIKKTNKLVSLCFFSGGAVSYFLKTENHFIFNFIFFNFYRSIKRYFKNFVWALVCFLKKLIFISHVELTPGTGGKYCLSSGCKAKLMVVDKVNQLSLVQLPSKIKKNMSYYSLVFLGSLSLEEKKKFHNTKSGYWRSLGFKSTVRGVAMNAVDHPHGGRTKAVRYQRTPWGKTTKFK